MVNSENHIIVDGETKPISNDHIYASVFEQFATGAATIDIRIDVLYDFSVKYPKEARLGCIYMRPGIWPPTPGRYSTECGWRRN